MVRALPRFVAASLAKRLSSRGVTVRSYSAVRYITAAADQDPSSGKALDVYTCKTFDSMDADVTRAAHVAVVSALMDFHGQLIE